MNRTLLACMLAAALAPTSQAKRAGDLRQPNGAETLDVIVQYKTQPTDRHFDKVRGKSGHVLKANAHIPSAAMRVNSGALAALENDPDVLWISPDRPVSGLLENTSGSVQVWPVDSWLTSQSMAKGGGIGLAVLDSGLYASHPNFGQYQMPSRSRIVYSQSFVDANTNDGFGHGTHVAGIAAGMDNVTDGVATQKYSFWGMAPDLNIINLKVLDAQGRGTDSAVIAAIDRAIALKSTYNIRIMNLSLGRPVRESYKTDPLCQAVERAWRAGIVVVVAAGNSGRDNSVNNNGYATINSPGNDPLVITVGASNGKGDSWRDNDVIATYSSKGPTAVDHVVKPDLVAPGNRVGSYEAPNSTLVMQYPNNRYLQSEIDSAGGNTPSSYFYKLSGTSMAAPVVSGAVALLLTKDATLTPDQIKFRLMKTAWRGFPTTVTIYDPATAKYYNASHDAFTIGAGMLDVNAAWNNNEKPTGSAASPIAYYDPGTRKVTFLLNSTNATNIVWGVSGIGATNLVWGSSNVSGLNLVWGSNIIWGVSTMTGFNIIWGTASPWANASPQTESLSVAIRGE